MPRSHPCNCTSKMRRKFSLKHKWTFKTGSPVGCFSPLFPCAICCASGKNSAGQNCWSAGYTSDVCCSNDDAADGSADTAGRDAVVPCQDLHIDGAPWRDSSGFSCALYVGAKWCRAGGVLGTGEGWSLEDWGPFEGFKASGGTTSDSNNYDGSEKL